MSPAEVHIYRSVLFLANDEGGFAKMTKYTFSNAHSESNFSPMSHHFIKTLPKTVREFLISVMDTLTDRQTDKCIDPQTVADGSSDRQTDGRRIHDQGAETT